MTPLLRVDGLRKRFGPTVALDGVSFSLRAGEVHALIGENGAGKSTLMNVLAGALRADAGTIAIDGTPYVPAAPLDAQPARHRAHPPGALALPAPDGHREHPDGTGAVAVRASWTARRPSAQAARAARATSRTPSSRPARMVGDLPIAAQQVVEICRALASRARILLMDEPTSSLQRADVDHLFALIRRLRDAGPRHRLHQPLPRGDSRDRRRLHRARATARAWRPARIGDATNEQLVAQMVGPSGRESVPRTPAARRARSCSP